MALRNLALSWRFSPALQAQTQTATVRGVITDTSAAVIPGAAVTLTNIDQNRSWHAATNAEGEYVFVQIPPGFGTSGCKKNRSVVPSSRKPAGKLIQFVPIPTDEVTNCAFGGEDWKTLFITAGGNLWRLHVNAPGWVPFAQRKR